MNNGFQIFNSPEFKSIRCGVIDDEVWFVAKDVAEALEYIAPRHAVANYCKHARLVNSRGTDLIPLNDFKDLQLPTNPYGFKIIPESDFYVLVFKSRMPRAEAFQQWVCSEVLPTLRKTGTYSLETTNDMLQGIASTLASLKEDIASLKDKAPVRAIKTRKPDAVKPALDDSNKYLTVNSMCSILQDAGYNLRYVTVIGRVLSQMSSSMNYAKAHEGSVYSYHENVWDAFFDLTEKSDEFMHDYRII